MRLCGVSGAKHDTFVIEAKQWTALRSKFAQNVGFHMEMLHISGGHAVQTHAEISAATVVDHMSMQGFNC